MARKDRERAGSTATAESPDGNRGIGADESVRTILAATRRFAVGSTPIVVALDGRSGVGKSTLAAALCAMTDGVTVPADDFFAAHITTEGWDSRSAEERVRDALDWRRLRADALEPLRSRQAAAWFPFDFAGQRADGSYPMSTALVRREPAPLIILEGAYCARPELADLVDVAVLVTMPDIVRGERLEARESPAFLAEWHRRWDAAEDYYFTRVRPPEAFDIVVTAA